MFKDDFRLIQKCKAVDDSVELFLFVCIQLQGVKAHGKNPFAVGQVVCMGVPVLDNPSEGIGSEYDSYAGQITDYYVFFRDQFAFAT